MTTPTPPPTTSMIGASVPRVEDRRLLTGAGRYLDDLGADALAVAFVRSPHAHARVVDIDVSGAVDVEGVFAVYLHEDLPGQVGKRLPALIPNPALHAPRTGYALAEDEVNHVGEPVVMVVARDRYLAEDACQRIRVDYEPLPAVIGLGVSRTAGTTVHDDVPDNVSAYMLQETGDVPAALAAAPHRLRQEFDVERSAAMPLEGKGVLASWAVDTSTLHVHSSTQTPTSLRSVLATTFELPLAKVHVVAPDTGGGFGVKIMHAWPEEILVPWAAMMLGRPVKWVEDRWEHFVSSAHERGQHYTVDVGFDDDGRILGLDVEILHDNGAYTPYGIIIPIISATQLVGPYRIPHYRARFWSLYTNTVIVTPYRGVGRPHAVFVMERTIDRIAQLLGIDTAHVRARNFVQPDEMPYDVGLIFQDGRPLIYDSGDYPAMLDRLKKLIGWDAFPALRAQAAAEGRRIGIGIGCYVEGTGGGPYEGGHVHVEPSGRVSVSTGVASQGQGHQTALAQIVADELGVPFESIHVTTGDTAREPYGVGTFASRTAVNSGNAVAGAAREVREKALRIAADALEAAPEDLQIRDGFISVKGDPSAGIDLRTVAVLANPLRFAYNETSKAATQFARPKGPDEGPLAAGDGPGLEARDYFAPVRSTFASGMHAAIVETDPETAEIKILRYAVVHDCGTLINPLIVEGQIHGGVAQGIGGALYERLVYDKSGQLLNASFMDFLMPYATEIPEIEIDHLQTPSPLNPLGVKGAGEAGVIPTDAAIAAAIEDAEGFRVLAMPISPSELYELRCGYAAREIESKDPTKETQAR